MLIENGTFKFGKHEGDAVDAVASTDSTYLRWVLDSSEELGLSQFEGDAVRAALAVLDDCEPGSDGDCGACARCDPEWWATVAPPEPPPFLDDNDGDFSLPPPVPAFEWTREQHEALDAISEWRLGSQTCFSLTGPAGTGKTTLLREVVSRYPDAALTAMTGKAALRLSQLTGQPATTLHKILYWPPKAGEDVRFTRVREPEHHFVICDESSMMTPTVYRDLSNWGVRVLLVGDSYQLPPVITDKKDLEQFGEDYSVFSVVRGAALETVMRSVGGVLRAATKVRETGEIVRESDDGYEFIRSSSVVERATEEYLSDRDDHLLITWKNATRMAANRLIRERLGRDGDLPDEGEPVLLRRNGQGFLNGEVVECGGFEIGPVIGSVQCAWMCIAGGARLLVAVEGGNREQGGEFFDGGFWTDNWRGYHIDLRRGCYPEPIPVTWGYCLTAHSAQGSEARRATVFLCRGDERNTHFRKPTTLPSGKTVPFSARWLYTATTRSKSRTTMIVGK